MTHKDREMDRERERESVTATEIKREWIEGERERAIERKSL